jgi:multimeric flavodoxin WrbA
LVDAFVGAMKKKGNVVRLLHLNDMNIRPCQGCLSCAETGLCRINDDMGDIRTSSSTPPLSTGGLRQRN